jgi:hypothetical protein
MEGIEGEEFKARAARPVRKRQEYLDRIEALPLADYFPE